MTNLEALPSHYHWLSWRAVILLGVAVLWLACAALIIFDFLDVDCGFCHCTYQDANGDEFAYQLFVPHGYRSGRKWPLILFLHGADKSGEDGEKPVTGGLGPEVRRREASFPFLVVFPQSARRSWHETGEDAQRALAIVDEVCRGYAVDQDHVYLAGYSMGGAGVWSLAAAVPERWAAVVSVSGFGDPTRAARFAHLPSWCFHGARDEVVSVEQSRAMVRALKEAGGRPRYTEYPDLGHGASELAYGTDELYEWLLQQRRGQPASEASSPP